MTNGNTYTNSALKVFMDRIFNVAPTYGSPTKVKVGSGTNTAVVADTDLQTPVEVTSGVYFQNFSSGYPIVDLATLNVTMRVFLNTLEANGNSISEMGVFTSDGTLMSRVVFTPITKTNIVEVSFVQKDKIEADL